MLLRKIEDGDSIAELTDLLHRAYAPLAARGMRYVASHQDEATTRERMMNGETHVVVLERIVGTVTIHPFDPNPDCAFYAQRNVATMEMLAVDPPFQRRGIASRLIGLAEERAREWKSAEMALDTSEKAVDLIAMYQKLGYRIVDRLRRGHVNYASVVLSKKL